MNVDQGLTDLMVRLLNDSDTCVEKKCDFWQTSAHDRVLVFINSSLRDDFTRAWRQTVLQAKRSIHPSLIPDLFLTSKIGHSSSGKIILCPSGHEYGFAVLNLLAIFIITNRAGVIPNADFVQMMSRGRHQEYPVIGISLNQKNPNVIPEKFEPERCVADNGVQYDRLLIRQRLPSEQSETYMNAIRKAFPSL